VREIKLYAVLVLVSCLLALSSAEATVYYVDSSTGNNANPGSEQEPWLTIHHAAGALLPGDSVLVAKGTYREIVIPARSGLPGQPISFIALGDSVILDGTGIELSDWYGLFTLEASWLLIEGFNITNCQGSGMNLTFAHNVVLRSNRVTNTTKPAIRATACTSLTIEHNRVDFACTDDSFKAAINVEYCDSVRITENQVRRTPLGFGIHLWGTTNGLVDSNYTDSTYLPGIAASHARDIDITRNEVVGANAGGNGEGIALTDVNRFTVNYNEVHHDGEGELGGEGIDCKGGCANGEVAYNHCHNLQRQGIYIDAWGAHTHDIEIHHNVCHNTLHAGIALSTEISAVLENIQVHHNLIYDCAAEGIVVANWLADTLRRNISITHNTIHNCGQYWGGGINVETEWVDSIVIINNLVSDCGHYQLSVIPEARDQVTASFNLLNGPQGGASPWNGFDVVVGDPMFVDVAGFDFGLSEGSPAIDAGHPDSSYLDPDGTRGDIGAFHHSQLCCDVRGDSDGSGSGPDIADLVFTIAYMFSGGPPPECLEAADINHDGTHGDIADLVALVAFMFSGCSDCLIPCNQPE